MYTTRRNRAARRAMARTLTSMVLPAMLCLTLGLAMACLAYRVVINPVCWQPGKLAVKACTMATLGALPMGTTPAQLQHKANCAATGWCH